MTFNKHFTQLFEEKVVSSLLVTFKQKLEKRIEESKYTASKTKPLQTSFIKKEMDLFEASLSRGAPERPELVVDRSDFLPKIPNRTEPIKFLPNRSDTEPNRSRFFLLFLKHLLKISSENYYIFRI